MIQYDWRPSHQVDLILANITLRRSLLVLTDSGRIRDRAFRIEQTCTILRLPLPSLLLLPLLPPPAPPLSSERSLFPPSAVLPQGFDEFRRAVVAYGS
jgi:hypothetical protein